MAITRPFWCGISPMRFFVVEDEDGMWSWQLKSDDDDIVAASSVKYTDIAAARHAVEEVKRGIGSAALPPDLD
jgi:uncharacterized protein YegP (UPF0339 family)